MAEQQLRELGEKLESPPSSKDELVELLKKMATALSEIEQSPRPSVLESLNSCFEAFSKPELLKHEDSDVKVLVATCICEITRITAPEAPYSDDVLRDMFELIVGTFSGLNDSNSSTFSRRVAIVETLARYRSCVVMLDLDCNDLINEMFHTFFGVVSDDHSQSVVSSMQTIMVVIIEESEEIQENLLLTILSALGRKNPGFSLAARRLAKSVVQNCVEKLESPIKQFLVSSISGEGAFLSNTIDHHEVIFDLYQCGPQILTGIVPFITGELLTDKLEVRSKAVELIGELISLPGVPILESFQPLFSEFLKRLTDRVVDLRISVIEHLKNCLISHPSRPEASQIIQALCDRLLDFDENVRKKVVAAICDVAHHEFDAIQVGTIELVAKRLRDTSISVKKYTMERLSDMYRLYCEKSTDSSKNAEEFEWIPGKILKCLYDKDFRPETIEHVMIDYFPSEFSVKDRAKHWIRAFSGFDKIETKALEQILLQKQRLQQEVQKYLALRQTPQEEAPDLQKRIAACFRSMSRLFHDHSKAEESLNALNQLKDANVWKLLSTLLDPATPFQQARSTRDELLKIIEEKHPLHEFMSMLSVRCSYLLINKEHVKEFLSVASEEKSSGNIDLLSACMNLLTVIASFFPLLFAGSEESLVNLIKEDNEILKEGIAHVLAKAGGIIREELASTSSSIDLILERLCLEGSRKQAKYSVHALAAVTKDDGLKSLSVLYKRIVDTLEEKVHLPSALQSLGCIAQIAMPIFETREEEIVGFLNNKILENSNKVDEVSPSPSKSEWGERSELCSLKIYALKTLVNSYLPSKDAHARKGIEKLLGLLTNILSYGDVSPNMFSSTIDKAHLRLASAKAVLRLSRQWDAQIPTDVFYLTLRISQDENPQSRKIFLGKVHQYIKERVLDAKYACAYLLNISKYHLPEYEECKHNLLEVVQICQQVKIRQLSVQADMNLLTAYPEYILAYLVHALAHDPFCPKFEEGTDIDAFGPLYWRLSLFLSVLLVGDESTQGGSAPNKENYSTVVAILHSIKSSQDLVDADKTQCLHAISDLGLVIAKRLFPDGSEISQTQAVPLPTQLYTTPEKSEQENGMEDEHTWSAAEGVVIHFEALKVEEEEMIDDQSLLPVTDGYGNELPLGKMLKIIKAQGAKRKKEAKKEVKPKDPFEFDGDDDVLGLVREINSESMDGGKKKELASKKRQLEKGNASSTPKKKRSVPVYQSPQKKTEEKKSIKTEKDASKRENMSSASTSFEEKNKSVDARSSNGSVNKRKRESFLGLEKCSTKGDEEDPEEELVGKRIKVWWPLDKQYYHGMVGSYDASKKKHTILYDDGDKEVLNLGKQKWKLLSSDSSAKRQKVDQKMTPKTTPKDSLEKKQDPTTQSGPVTQKGPTKKSPPSKKKGSSGRPRGRPKKTTSGSAAKDSATEDPADDSDADVDGPNDDGTKDKKEEEPVAESWEKSGDGEKQSDDEDEPLSTWKANLTKVK